MSAEARATLIVEAKTDQAQNSLAGLGKSGAEAGKGTKSSFADATKELTGFNVASLAGVGAITAVLGVMKSSIDTTSKWADEIDRLSRATGTSAKETSLMATVFGDVGISVSTLESSFKVLTKNGLQPNIETFKNLAREYQSIQDPVARNTFALKNLGRSAAEMTEILSKTPDELDALAAAASRSGKVIDEELIAKSEKLAIQSKQLQDKLEGLQIMIGGPLIDVLSQAATGFDMLSRMIELNTVEMQLQYGAITEQEAQLKRLEIATGGAGQAWEEYNETINPVLDAHDRAAATTQTVTAEQKALEYQTAALNTVWQSYGPTVSDAAVKNWELQQTLEPLTGAASDLAFGMGELTTATLFHQAAQGLDAEASLALAESMGLIDAGAAAAKSILDELRTQLESGAISTEQYTSNVTMLNNAINSLPDGKTITIELFEEYRQAFNQELSGQGGTETGQISGATGDGYASGGQAVPNQPMIVGDGGRAEVFVPTQSGYVYPVMPNESNTSSTGTVVFNISGVTDPVAVAREVDRKLEEVGRRGDRRMRT